MKEGYGPLFVVIIPCTVSDFHSNLCKFTKISKLAGVGLLHQGLITAELPAQSWRLSKYSAYPGRFKSNVPQCPKTGGTRFRVPAVYAPFHFRQRTQRLLRPPCLPEIFRFRSAIFRSEEDKNCLSLSSKSKSPEGVVSAACTGARCWGAAGRGDVRGWKDRCAGRSAREAPFYGKVQLSVFAWQPA